MVSRKAKKTVTRSFRRPELRRPWKSLKHQARPEVLSVRAGTCSNAAKFCWKKMKEKPKDWLSRSHISLALSTLKQKKKHRNNFFCLLLGLTVFVICGKKTHLFESCGLSSTLAFPSLGIGLASHTSTLGVASIPRSKGSLFGDQGMAWAFCLQKNFLPAPSAWGVLSI